MLFHSKLALDPLRCFVACKIVNNCCFSRILTSVQILGVICKNQKVVDMACYSVPMRITGSGSMWPQSGQAPPSRASPHARPHTCLAAWGRHEVDEPHTCSSTPPSDHTLQPPLFSSFCSNTGELLAPWNSPRLLPVRAPKHLHSFARNSATPWTPHPKL